MRGLSESIKALYAQFCKETNRSGGVLISGSIKEWTQYLLDHHLGNGVRWVKASERLPKIGWFGECRLDNDPWGSYIFDGKIFWTGSKWLDDYDWLPIEERLTWLDESESPIHEAGESKEPTPPAEPTQWTDEDMHAAFDEGNAIGEANGVNDIIVFSDNDFILWLEQYKDTKK